MLPRIGLSFCHKSRNIRLCGIHSLSRRIEIKDRIHSALPTLSPVSLSLAFPANWGTSFEWKGGTGQ